MSEPFRLFIATPIPSNLKHALHQHCLHLQTLLPFQKWIHPDDYHITLKFLGDTPDAKIVDITQQLQAIAVQCPSYSLSLGDLGAFGPPQSPQILWAGLQGDVDSLTRMQQRIEQQLTTIGFPVEERAFRPHLTIARRYAGKQPFNRQLLPTIQKTEQIRLPWSEQKIVLYRSHLNRSPMYEAIARFPLITHETMTKEKSRS